MRAIDNGAPEGSRRYEVQTTSAGRVYVDQIDEDNITALVRRIKRGEWVKTIHDWHINPAHVVSVRLSR